jgi:hypothetical protein
MQDRQTSQTSTVSLLVTLAAVTVFLGWFLSSIRKLTHLTLPALLLMLLLPIALYMNRNIQTRHSLARFTARVRARWRRPLPVLFYLSLLLNFVSGLIYAPNNYDALSYRIPRLLAWLSNHGWYWIPTSNQRMNFSGTVQEWLFSPLLDASHSDRLLFLLNLAVYSLMPYLLFSIFCRLGIRSRVAWWWMWLLPLSMGIVLQAGGIGNDLLGVFFFLAAIDTALRFRDTLAPGLMFCSMLSIALCTGVKLSNLPLVLPWLVLVVPATREIMRLGWRVVIVALLALIVSITPTIALNQAYTGNWTGDPGNQYEMHFQNPLAGVVGNSVLIATNTLIPPILPAANRLEAYLNDLPFFHPGSWLVLNFPQFRIFLNELPQEEASGLGMLLVFLFVWSMVQAIWSRVIIPESGCLGVIREQSCQFFLAMAVAILSFMSMLGSLSAARLFLPYSFPIVAFGLWLRDSSRLVRTRAWRFAALASATVTLIVVIVSPSRPLFPVKLTLRAVSSFVPSSVINRATTVYDTYAHRADAFAEIRKDLEKDDQVLGLVSSGNDLETSLWLPIGSRRLVHVLPQTTTEELIKMGVRKVLVSQRAMQSMPATSVAQMSWLSRGRLLATYSIQQFASEPPDIFELIDIELVQN